MFFCIEGNHLGNVLVTVSDRRLAYDVYSYTYNGTSNQPYIKRTSESHYQFTTGTTGTHIQASGSDGFVDFYKPDVLTASDYFCYGAPLGDRTFSATDFRYGFNGKENDEETGLQDYGLRIYNPALAKFLSVDPLTADYPWYTPYQFAGNKPIQAVDLDGAEESISIWGHTTSYQYRPDYVTRAGGTMQKQTSYYNNTYTAASSDPGVGANPQTTYVDANGKQASGGDGLMADNISSYIKASGLPTNGKATAHVEYSAGSLCDPGNGITYSYTLNGKEETTFISWDKINGHVANTETANAFAGEVSTNIMNVFGTASLEIGGLYMLGGSSSQVSSLEAKSSSVWSAGGKVRSLGGACTLGSRASITLGIAFPGSTATQAASWISKHAIPGLTDIVLHGEELNKHSFWSFNEGLNSMGISGNLRLWICNGTSRPGFVQGLANWRGVNVIASPFKIKVWSSGSYEFLHEGGKPAPFSEGWNFYRPK